MTDGVLFYFMNMKGGQRICETSPLCGATKPPKACGFKCLFGSCAEASLPNLADEIADFSEALPAGHPIHVGIYWSGYSDCGTPSASYNFAAFETALALPSVAGVTVYADMVSTYKTVGQYKSCPTVKKGSIPPAIDKGCLVKQIFAQFTHSDSAAVASAATGPSVASAAAAAAAATPQLPRPSMTAYLVALCEWILTLDVGSNHLKGGSFTPAATYQDIFINGNLARVLLSTYKITGNDTYLAEGLRWCDTLVSLQYHIESSTGEAGGYWDTGYKTIYIADTGTAVTNLVVGCECSAAAAPAQLRSRSGSHLT